MSSPRFKAEFIRPRNALTLFVFLLVRLASWLPRKLTLAIGKLLGSIFYWVNKKRRNIAAVNLSLCFPEKSAAEREQMARVHFQNYGMTTLDLGLIWWGSKKKLDRWVRFEGLDQVNKILAKDQRIIFMGPHAVSMDLGGIALSSKVYLASMMKRASDGLINWLLLYGRNRFGGEMVMRDDGIRALIRKMRKGRSVYLIPDEDFGHQASFFVPFFGVQRSTLSVVGRLAGITKAAVVPIFTSLDTRTGIYTVHLGEALKDFPSGDEQQDTLTVSQALEQCIRIAPDQYMWTFRWFKTRPNGEPSPYLDKR
ncbi:MAG: KDO2-lipid IV(A) lauroyltransferase [Parasphingorhabdus sp.]|jgi:KDO2-lipid IV(A) lauroyltransferase